MGARFRLIGNLNEAIPKAVRSAGRVGRDDLWRPRRVKSRAVSGIDQDIKLNKALWLLGERMAELKAGR